MSLPALTTVGGELVVQFCPALVGLSMPALTTVNGQMVVRTNPLLRQCLVDAIRLHITTGPSSYVTSGNDGAPIVCP